MDAGTSAGGAAASAAAASASGGATVAMPAMPATLRATFDEATALRKKIHSSKLPSMHAELQVDVQRCLKLLLVCEKRVDTQSVFSANETMDDFKTSDVCYLLVPFFIGDMMQRMKSEGGPEQRVRILDATMRQLKVFLTVVERVGAVRPEDLKVIQREADEKVDRATARTEKIARFRREKAEDNKMKELTLRKRMLARDAEDAESVEDGDMEEVEREMSLVLIDRSVRQSIEMLDISNQEATMLRHMAEHIRKNPAHATQDRRALEDDIGHREGRLDAASSSARTGVMARSTERNNILREIYAPVNGWSILPEEFAEMEMAEMEKTSKAKALATHEAIVEANMTFGRESTVSASAECCDSGRGSHAAAGCEAEEKSKSDDEDEDEDAKTIKAREWDDWCDDNPKGIGNTLR